MSAPSPAGGRFHVKPGDKVWVRFAWGGGDCWNAGEFIRETAKRILVRCDRGIIYVAKRNVRPRAEGST